MAALLMWVLGKCTITVKDTIFNRTFAFLDKFKLITKCQYGFRTKIHSVSCYKYMDEDIHVASREAFYCLHLAFTFTAHF